MKNTIFLFFTTCAAASVRLSAQEYVVHTDLPIQQTKNTSYQLLMNDMYNTTLDSVNTHRKNTAYYTAAIEQVQNTIVKNLTNVESAVQNGKALYYASQKIPAIFTNMETALTLAAQKPYLIGMAQQCISAFITRTANLTSFVQQIINSTDGSILINQAHRNEFTKRVYDEITVLYNLSAAIVNDFKIYNLQDAINKIVPIKMFVNMDATIVKDLFLIYKF